MEVPMPGVQVAPKGLLLRHYEIGSEMQRLAFENVRCCVKGDLDTVPPTSRCP